MICPSYPLEVKAAPTGSKRERPATYRVSHEQHPYSYGLNMFDDLNESQSTQNCGSLGEDSDEHLQDEGGDYICDDRKISLKSHAIDYM